MTEDAITLRADALARELERTGEGSRALIRAALRSARAEAIEDAAKVVGVAAREVAQGECPNDCSCRWQEQAAKYQRGIESAIRALSPATTGGKR